MASRRPRVGSRAPHPPAWGPGHAPPYGTPPGSATSNGAGRALSGAAFSGAGYYVWDEDPRRAREWARELDAASSVPGGPGGPGAPGGRSGS